MLDSVDAKVRLSKATELVDRHLQASYRVNDASFEMKAIKEELGDNDDEEDDLAALERKMQSAGMPQNTWKLALREFRYL
ncbi:LON protease peroxisomal-like [Trifolium medium]|uniref:LON protease peroxisomal-like n=1 Tax=Trifolium medium TaxID=97028 RepID=A0A392MPC7_9FABA|nr:LON protease peroxisomal-like [Trifolium medium]